jgi:hypothetical protein
MTTEPTCSECGATIQGEPFDGDPPRPRHCWNCQAIYTPPTAIGHLTDLAERIREKATICDGMAETASDDWEKIRLAGKASGIRLALSFVEEYRRGV